MKKVPKQERARRTVDFILEAAAYILAEDGLDGFTTNRIAERAGVNIASLYQYFPDKMAILEALQSRHVVTPFETYGQWRERLKDLSLSEIAAVIVDAALEAHIGNLAMHRAFLNALPRRTRQPYADFGAERLAQMAQVFLPVSRTAEAPDMMVFIARHAFTAALHEAICERPEWLSDPAFRPAFRNELIRLLVAYLKPAQATRE